MSFLQRLFARGTPPASHHRTARRKLPPRIERLEERCTPAGAGPETPLNATTALDQTEVASASTQATSGNVFLHVDVWTTQVSGTDFDIHARLFDSSGLSPATDIVIAATAKPESEPAAAMDAKGNWVVVWTVTQPNGKGDVFAAQFDATGNPRRAPFAIAHGVLAEHEPNVAARANGDFVVTYTLDRSATNSDVLAKVYRDNHTLLKTITVAGTPMAEHHATIARNTGGFFSIAYQRESNAGDVLVNRYGVGGQLLQKVALATTAAAEQFPDVAIDDDNNTFVAWQQAPVSQDFDIVVQMVRAANRQLGPLRGIASNATADELFPSLVVEADGGKDLAVAYQVGADSTGAARSVTLKEFDYDSNLVLDTHDLGANRAAPSLSIGTNEEMQVGYLHLDAATITTGEAGTGIYARRINLSA
jgi:hypothetical protein